MRYLTILILFLGAAAQAEVHECVTRTPAIEARHDAMCPLAAKYATTKGEWTDKKCATFFYEGGLRVFSNRVDQEAASEVRRVAKCESRNKDRLFDDGDLQDCSPPPPTPTPTVEPTPYPTPAPTVTP